MSNVSSKAKRRGARAPKAAAAGSARLSAKPLIVIGLGCALLFGAFVAFTNGPRPAPVIGGQFQLTTQNGQSFSEADLVGRPHLVFFGYTNCQDISHATLFEMSEILRAMGPNANVGGVFVTVDPERDAPELMKDYLSNFDPRIVGLTGPHAALDPMLREYRILANRSPGSWRL